MSQLFRSSTPAMAVFLGYLLMVAVFNIPEEYRIPAQLWSYFPTVSTNLSNAFSQRLLAVGDVFLTGMAGGKPFVSGGYSGAFAGELPQIPENARMTRR